MDRNADRLSIDEMLDRWFVQDGPPMAPVSDTGETWFGVGNEDDGIVAYFQSECAAFRFRLAEINRELNG